MWGKYWEAPVELVGVPKGFQEVDGSYYVRFEARGTRQEGLLRYLSGQKKKEVLLHLCAEPCTHLVWKDGIIHIDQVEKVGMHVEEWMTNAMAVREPAGLEDEIDELAALRKEMEDQPPGVGDRDQEKEAVKKKRKKEKEEKDKGKKEQAAKSSSSRKMKVKARKEISEVFQATGMDPDPTVRRRFRKKAQRMQKRKKKIKKKKGSSLSGSTSEESGASSSSGHSTQEVGQPSELFGETSVVRKIGTKYPGVLTAAWVRESQDVLMTSQGQMWHQVEGPLPPVSVQFFRQMVAPRMGGAMAREYFTLAYMLDLAMQGRVAELCDVGVQRLKSLSSTQSGVHYSVSQRLELLPYDRTVPASLQETQAAAKAAEQEDRVLQRASKSLRPWGTQSGQESWKGGKGKEGKGKKGKSKESRKGDEQKGGATEGKK